MPRKGENIRKRQDGRWEARYIKGYGADGKARYGYLYAKTYMEARRKKAEALSSCDAGDEGGKRMLLSDALERWLESRRHRVKQSTFSHYAGVVRNHLIPAVGACPLRMVTGAVVDRYVRDKGEGGRLDGGGGLSPKTIADQVNVLRWALRYAAAQNWLPSVPACQAPKAGKFRPETFNDLDWMRLNRHVRDNLDGTNLGILLAMHTGLRIGEVCGLRYSDIDMASGVLSVNRTLIRVKEEGKGAAKTRVIADTPKTEHSRRKLPLPASLLPPILRQYKGAASADAYLITGTERYMEPRTYYRRYQEALRRCGIAPHTFHAMRHTFATRCIERGCDPKTLSELLGHADVKITLERYVHPSMRSKRAVMERLESEDSRPDAGVATL